ncbi:hypothetical protein EXIGLDRAFT_839120 [Exidia glandulosa HHB12029]|uniref:Bacteriophage T5 Orf172 DNA-binding domain-containing protein n=1 Tax=Exidia glandulosa HHB12029 TaxID=1314781 RepID=A0A165F8R4_EXIGL|nr:hypothetical protein EXIGLDRAFT_839120 [Exidia glandulosa HHB12029]
MYCSSSCPPTTMFDKLRRLVGGAEPAVAGDTDDVDNLVAGLQAVSIGPQDTTPTRPPHTSRVAFPLDWQRESPRPRGAQVIYPQLEPLSRSPPSTPSSRSATPPSPSPSPSPPPETPPRAAAPAPSANFVPFPTSSPPYEASPKPRSPGSVKIQCTAMTRQRVRCKNRFKPSPETLQWERHDSNSDDSEENSTFCHMHRKTESVPFGFLSRSGEFVEFSDWISPLTSAQTQKAIRLEMVKEISPSDPPGFIYVYKVEEDSHDGALVLKIGRSNNVTRRIGEWEKQCGKTLVVLGFWPAVAPMCKCSGRVERLSQLELADVSVYAPYMAEAERPPPPDKKRVRVKSITALARPPNGCDKCGEQHREIFTFLLPSEGPYKDEQVFYDVFIKSSVGKWVRFGNLIKR